MTKTPPKDIGASVRARLLRVARDQGEDFQLVLMRYANERLLFRLASSRYAERFVLKGAALFTLWTGKPHRAPRDLDLRRNVPSSSRRRDSPSSAALSRRSRRSRALGVGWDGLLG